MKASSQTLIYNPQIEWSELLSVSFLVSSTPSPLVCVSVCVRPWKYTKSRKEKEEKKRKKERKKESEKEDKLNCQDSLRALTSSPAVSFACLKPHHAAKETKYKICSISQLYYIRITRPTIWKRNTSHAVLNANNGKKSEINYSNVFCRKKSKAERGWPSKPSFLQWPTFVMWYRCSHPVESLWLSKKANRPWQIKGSFLAFSLSSQSSSQR